LGGSHSSARAISNDDVVVGSALTSNDLATHGFVYVAGEMLDLNDLIADSEWVILQAFDVNDTGEILAVANRGRERDEVVLLLPHLDR
jgi:probable HAF family extracellular repeat protein